VVTGSEVDWTQVLLAAIGIVPATIAAVGTYLLHRQLRTPSGDTIGKVTERTHDLTAADVALTKEIHGRVMHRQDDTQPHAQERHGD